MILATIYATISFQSYTVRGKMGLVHAYKLCKLKGRCHENGSDHRSQSRKSDCPSSSEYITKINTGQSAEDGPDSIQRYDGACGNQSVSSWSYPPAMLCAAFVRSQLTLDERIVMLLCFLFLIGDHLVVFVRIGRQCQDATQNSLIPSETCESRTYD